LLLVLFSAIFITSHDEILFHLSFPVRHIQMQL
jgi:hypothetical protein